MKIENVKILTEEEINDKVNELYHTELKFKNRFLFIKNIKNNTLDIIEEINQKMKELYKVSENFNSLDELDELDKFKTQVSNILVKLDEILDEIIKIYNILKEMYGLIKKPNSTSFIGHMNTLQYYSYNLKWKLDNIRSNITHSENELNELKNIIKFFKVNNWQDISKFLKVNDWDITFSKDLNEHDLWINNKQTTKTSKNNNNHKSLKSEWKNFIKNCSNEQLLSIAKKELKAYKNHKYTTYSTDENYIKIKEPNLFHKILYKISKERIFKAKFEKFEKDKKILVEYQKQVKNIVTKLNEKIGESRKEKEDLVKKNKSNLNIITSEINSITDSNEPSTSKTKPSLV